MKVEFYLQIVNKVSNIRFHENPSSGSRVVPCGQTDRQTDMTKLVVAFRNFANQPKDELFFSIRLCSLSQFPSSRRWAKRLFISQFFRCWYAGILDVVLRLELKPRGLGYLHFRAEGTTPAGPFSTLSVLQHFILNL